MSFPANTTSRGDPGVQAIISLGSNLGLSRGAVQLNSESILRLALAALQELSTSPLISSSFYRTAPLDCPTGAPDFINAIALLQARPEHTASGLLQELQAIEAHFGRTRENMPNQPRPLDLDLISFGQQQWHAADLVLPHPRAHLRRFVMVPLAEVAPDLILPGQQLTARELAQRLLDSQENDQWVQRLPEK